MPEENPAPYPQPAESPARPALRDISAAVNGWRSECKDSKKKFIRANLKRLTIETHTYEKSDCTGFETQIGKRISYSLANLPATFGYPMEAALVMRQLEFRLSDYHQLATVNSVKGTVGGVSVTGVCGITNWQKAQWRDVTSTVCWNIQTDEGLGDGKVTDVTPILFEDEVVMGPINWSVSGSTMTFDHLEYTKL